MGLTVDYFIARISASSPNLSAAYHEAIDYWAPDKPPATVILSDIGRRVVDDFGAVDRRTNDELFKAIELALADGDEELRTAILTGMIEGMVGRAVRIGIWDKVLPMFGDRSAAHAVAWASQ